MGGRKMIKFRAWDKQEKRYFINGSAGILGNLVCCEDLGMLEPDEYTWEQFTGLKDKQGVDIYNGDILHFGSVWCVGDEYDPREEKHIGAVEYRPDYASYVVNCNGKIFPLEQVISFDGYSVEGNVHENVELLEKENWGPYS